MNPNNAPLAPDWDDETKWKRCSQCGRENSLHSWEGNRGKCPNCNDLFAKSAPLVAGEGDGAMESVQPTGHHKFSAPDGELDEVFIKNAAVHVERMDDMCFWIGIDPIDSQLPSLHIRTGVEEGLWWFRIEEDSLDSPINHIVERKLAVPSTPVSAPQETVVIGRFDEWFEKWEAETEGFTSEEMKMCRAAAHDAWIAAKNAGYAKLIGSILDRIDMAPNDDPLPYIREHAERLRKSVGQEETKK